MHMNKVPSLLLVLSFCELCSAIKVPVTWDDSARSEVKNGPTEESLVELVLPQNVHTKPPNQQPVPTDYFQYTAQKPKFAADIAAFHGVKNPEQHYKAYPIKPHTNKPKPTLGIHHMLDDTKETYIPFQKYVQQTSELNSFVKPTASNYEIFHPYKAEEPALQEIYKDPVLTKIRNDLQDSKHKFQAYENEAGEPNIAKDEYLESPEKTDGKLIPHQNIPVRYEIHKPERRPVYYTVPLRDFSRENLLNRKFKHPWNQYAKIRPVHYRPLQYHIHNLRQKHAMKYDDERNEYPQVPTSENIAEPQEGHDIYEKGKEKYLKLRNNLDESVNNVVQQNRPPTFQKLELQKHEPEAEEDKDEFIPVKNYAQVRKTETYKHLPKKAAFDDAETYEEIRNAPRLREAVKSTKAQTVYSEEGYEDSAYDHAGEQKHASDHEGHGGFLKEHENSGGLYKIPTVSEKYQDGRGLEYRDNEEHGEKWKNNNKDDEEETENEEFSEDEHEENVDAHLHENNNPEIYNQNRRKDVSRDDDDSDNNNTKTDNSSDDNGTTNSDDVKSDSDIYDDRNPIESYQANVSNEHEVGKREVNFKVPEIDINSTLSFKTEYPKLAKLKSKPKKEDIQEKYPYYYKHLKGINKNSPLKYAENLKLIPNKSNGGTEFYDSRSRLECSEVDEEVDPIPEKLKNGENPTEDEDYENDDESKGNKKFEIAKQPRLKGLGDKIDCFKAKYFGENPLDSPFFKEEIISNPEPIVAPTYKLKNIKGEIAPKPKLYVEDTSNRLQEAAQTNIFVLLDKLRSDQQDLNQSLNMMKKSNEELKTFLYTPQDTLIANDTQQTNVYTDILKNIKATVNPAINNDVPASLLYAERDRDNTTYNFFQNKEDVTKLPPKLRKKRATPFVYEPYKIIRDSQVQDSKKTTTTSNISPLIKQLQSSRVAERVSRSNKDDKQKTNSRTYVDIGKKERTKPTRNENENSDATFVDVSVDHRRGEPRYEIRPANHKSEYTPVENKRAMSVDAYRSHTTTDKNLETSTQKSFRGRKRFGSAQIGTRPFHDLSQFIPKNTDTQNVAASNSVKKTVANTDSENSSENPEEHSNDSSSEDNSGEYDKEEEDEITPSTTTTTPKPSFRRRIKQDSSRIPKTTTDNEPEYVTDKQLLKFVTRFRNYKPDENTKIKEEEPVTNKHAKEDDIVLPKYREKKKKSHTSTLVTDTQKYGEQEEDEMRKEEVDAMIGVKTDMDDYTPMYEKEEEHKMFLHPPMKTKENDSESGKAEVDDDDDDADDDDDDDYEDDDDDDDDDDEEDDDDDDENDRYIMLVNDGGKKKTEEDSTYLKEQVTPEPETTTPEPEVTTPEPTKRTLVRTTIAPPTTAATRIRTTSPKTPFRNNRPIVTRKRTEIHKEIPANKSSPHITQFKQDIKEVEIIKEIPAAPKKKPHKNVAVLDLYKDDELAKAINNLGDVEIFGDQIDLDNGPKHGGNYRKATKEDLRLLQPPESAAKPLKDAETSQSKSTKHIELDEYSPKTLHGGNLKSLSDVNRSRNNGRSSKLIELSDPPAHGMHGGNLKYNNKRRGGRRNEKLIELDENHEEDHSSRQDDDYKSRSSGHERMHGGNYRSAKIVAAAPQDDSDDIQVKSTSKNTRRSAAAAADLLNSFAQAVPILTSTPGYILDPSKRMYYYVD